MGELKDKVKQLRIVRKCWTDEIHCFTKEDCKRVGCPYANKDCTEDAFLDALEMVDVLWKERKRLKKRVEPVFEVTENNMGKCRYYHVEYGRGVCWATKEKDPCPHDGDRSVCGRA